MTSQDQLSKEEKIKLIIDYWHRTMMHHAIWYAEVKHQFGEQKAMKLLNIAYQKSYAIQMKRISKVMGFEMKDDIPEPMTHISAQKIDELKEAVAVNWLANDGVWFQSVEFEHSMYDAKRCNDSAWGQFSPLEAWSIKRFLNLDEKPGLEGLKKALQFRLYATINKQSIVEETACSFIFQMNDCRVQSARKRKGLDDYPCKSGGMVEYRSFAEAIDSRIKTECLSCPPDEHPDAYYCAWKFFMEE